MGYCKAKKEETERYQGCDDDFECRWCDGCDNNICDHCKHYEEGDKA